MYLANIRTSLAYPQYTALRRQAAESYASQLLHHCPALAWETSMPRMTLSFWAMPSLGLLWPTITEVFFKSVVLFSDKTGFNSGITVAENYYMILQLYAYYDQGTHPHIASVKAWRCTPYYGSPHIVVVETPSFYSDHDNLDALNGMTAWLESKFTEKCHSTILFLHSLDSDPTSGDMSMSWHLETFVKASRNKFTVPSDVYVVWTNNPDFTLPSETLKQRFSQLETMTERLKGNRRCNWRASVFPGVLKGQPETAWSTALLLLNGITQLQTTKSLASKPTLSHPGLQYYYHTCMYQTTKLIAYEMYFVARCMVMDSSSVRIDVYGWLWTGSSTPLSNPRDV
ncbi:hypothetical protein EDD15DRAFT_2194867 [Pisolithus albus]|nr:hypothetical protein EDD15DRAFT_2194867 [Pisolithus albus]